MWTIKGVRADDRSSARGCRSARIGTTSRPSAASEAIPGTAVVLVAPTAAMAEDGCQHGHGSAERPQAPFLAHLIATAQGLSQTRERRRAAPEHAAGVYTPAARIACGTRMSRSI